MAWPEEEGSLLEGDLLLLARLLRHHVRYRSSCKRYRSFPTPSIIIDGSSLLRPFPPQWEGERFFVLIAIPCLMLQAEQ